MLAARDIHETNPLLIAGLTSITDGTKDAYLIEGGQMVQYTVTDPKQLGTFEPAGDLINLEGQLGTYKTVLDALAAADPRRCPPRPPPEARHSNRRRPRRGRRSPATGRGLAVPQVLSCRPAGMDDTIAAQPDSCRSPPGRRQGFVRSRERATNTRGVLPPSTHLGEAQ